MDYQVLDLKTKAPLDTLELHVLARAYYAAWQAIHGTRPEGRHPLAMLGAFIDYGNAPTMRRPGPLLKD